MDRAQRRSTQPSFSPPLMVATVAASAGHKTYARELAIQFLYKCEIERVQMLCNEQLQAFLGELQIVDDVRNQVVAFVKGVFHSLREIDQRISRLSTHWALPRMPVTDRSVLRLAAFELLEGRTPYKVVINEAVETAKRYGTEHSGKFVNALLDAFRKEVQSDMKDFPISDSSMLAPISTSVESTQSNL